MPLRLDEGCPRRGEGTHKGCPYGWIWGAHEGGRAPTRGAPTVGYGVPAKGGGHPQGVPLRLDDVGALAGEGRPQGGRLPDSGSLRWVCPNLMQLPWARRAARLIFLWLRQIIVVDLEIHSSQVLGFVG